MKKIVKIFTLIITLAFLFTMTSCASSDGYKAVDITDQENIYKETVTLTKDNNKVINAKAADAKYVFIGYVDSVKNEIYLENYTFNFDDLQVASLTFDALYILAEKTPEGHVFVGLLEKDERVILYTKNSSTTLNNKEVIFVQPEAGHSEGEAEVSFPKVGQDGKTFSGWYKNEECTYGNRVATVGQATGVLYARYVTFGEGAVVTVVCILIVFTMLAILWGITSLLKIVNKKKEEEPKVETQVVEQPKQVFTMNDIKDDDMMAAALVATIEYHNETKKDVRVVSIKEIK